MPFGMERYLIRIATHCPPTPTKGAKTVLYNHITEEWEIRDVDTTIEVEAGSSELVRGRCIKGKRPCVRKLDFESVDKPPAPVAQPVVQKLLTDLIVVRTKVNRPVQAFEAPTKLAVDAPKPVGTVAEPLPKRLKTLPR